MRAFADEEARAVVPDPRSLLRYACVLALITLISSSLCAGAPTVTSRDNLKCAVESLDDGGVKVSNADARRGTIRVSGLDAAGPIVFELGREGRPLRRIYPSSSKGSLTITAAPNAEYVIYPTDTFVNSVLTKVCDVAADGLSRTEKLQALASVAAVDGKADGRSRRQAADALQALLGLEFSARMEYPSTEAGDYRFYAGGDFRVTSRVRNRGQERLSGLRVRLMAPDEWSVRPGSSSSFPVLDPGASVSSVHVINAPARTELRAPVFPLIATLTFSYSGREFAVNYPFEARLTDPFVPTLHIVKAHADRLDARIDLRTSYPGREMKGISVYPWLSTDLTIAPERQTVDMSGGRGSFRLSYLPKRSGASFQAVTVIMKLDEHLVRLRSVMHASLDLGVTATGAALWLTNYGDGSVIPATVRDRKCRTTTASSSDGPRYMCFAASPNLPGQGTTYVTVTYYDDAQGSFALQYDSADQSEAGVYKDGGDVVKFEGTKAWRTKTFALEDAGFSNRQNGKSDFRLAVTDGELAVSTVVVSKFTPGETE